MNYASSEDVPTPGCLLKGLGALVAGLLILCLLLYLIAPPVIHGIALMFWEHWLGLLFLGLAIAGVLIALVPSPYRAVGVVIAALFILVWIVSGFMGNIWRQEAFLANSNMQTISSEPETTGFRFLPLEVAKTTATNKTTDSTVTPGEVEPLINGNDATWIVPEEPNNTNTSWFGSQPGSLTINTTADTERDTTGYAPGYGLCCFNGRSLGWSSVDTHFWADYSPENYMTALDGETVIVQPYLTYYLDWSHLLPVMVPQWGGDLVIHSTGAIDDLSAQEAAAKYPGGRLYPHELADYFSHSYQLENGAWNYLFTHYNLPDIPHLGDTSGDNKDKPNQFPFLIPTESGPEWYTAVEPYGKSTSAYMSYYVNATDGTTKVYKFDEPLVGPDRAETFVNNAFNTLKGTYFYEPRPLVKNGNFYWMLSASASGTPDVQFTALVDAYSEDVIKLANKGQVERVVAGEDPHKVGEVVAASGSGSSSPAGESTTATSSTTSGTDGESTMSDEDLARLLREAADRVDKAKQ